MVPIKSFHIYLMMKIPIVSFAGEFNISLAEQLPELMAI